MGLGRAVGPVHGDRCTSSSTAGAFHRVFLEAWNCNDTSKPYLHVESYMRLAAALQHGGFAVAIHSQGLIVVETQLIEPFGVVEVANRCVVA